MNHSFMRLLAITAITTVLSTVSMVGLAQSNSGLLLLNSVPTTATFKDVTLFATQPVQLQTNANVTVDVVNAGPGLLEVSATPTQMQNTISNLAM